LNKKVKVLTVFLLILVVSADLSDAASAERKNVAPSIDFREYSEDAFIAAKGENKPVLILFFAHWCPWCKLFDETVLSDDSVYGFLNEKYINIFVDADLNEELKSKYGVTMLPYVVILRPDGKLQYKYGGMLDKNGFLSFIIETRINALK